MAISITDRPSKTLSNGFLSKWSSSELPLQYKLTSSLSPVNFRGGQDLTSLSYAVDKSGTRLIFLNTITDFISVNTDVLIEGTGTDLDGGIYFVKEQVSDTELIIDVYTTESSVTGTAVRNYRNYKGLVKVFAGSPDQHPYNIDGSKPLEEIGVIEVDFKDINGVNVGYADVRGYIKAAINAKFDTDENTHFGWSSYSIEFAQSYTVNGVVSQSDFEPDIEPTCDPAPVTFVDSAFDNGLDDWFTDETIVGGISYGTDWVDGVGSVSTSFTQGQTIGIYSEILSQDVNLYAGIPYIFTIDLTYSGDSPYSQIEILDSFGVKFGGLRITSSGVYEIHVTTDKNTANVGIAFGGAAFGKQVNIQLNSFQVATNVAKHCLYTQFATFGAKQFQDSLGGNFGDYVLNVVDTVTPKMLTHFDSKTFFKGKPFYFSGIIPASTFSLSEGGNNVFIDANLDNRQSIRVPVLNSGEGVYTVDLEPYLSGLGDWSNGTAQFIIIPTNIFVDADNGTFDNGTTTGITMTPESGGNTNIGSTITAKTDVARTGAYGAEVLTIAPNGMTASNKYNKIFETDTPINLIGGQKYEISCYISMQSNNYDPSMLNNGSIWILPSGYSITNDPNLTMTFFNIVRDNLYEAGQLALSDWIEVKTTFIANATGNETFKLYASVENDVTGQSTGFYANIDDITFKGPIEYISEVKPITNSKECDRYGGTLRWLNDLNGWETWNFTKKKIVKEKVAKKIDVVNDYSNDWDNSFINGETQKDTIQTTVNKSIVLRSQLLNTNQKTILEQIKRSARVQYLTDANKWQTVTIRASGYDVIDEEQKIHDMQIEINLPDLIIQAQ